MDVRIGTAGWNIPGQYRDRFQQGGSVLERYASRFGAVEINSTFHRPHRAATYERWARSVPEDFRFSVKVPREITHTRKLLGAEEPTSLFLRDLSHLGSKLGPLLVQLPPSLAFEPGTAKNFFSFLRSAFDGQVVCEPRHPSWFEGPADDLLQGLRVARVAADPAPAPIAAQPGGCTEISYWRLHGSPVMYRSGYSEPFLSSLTDVLCAAARRGRQCWCIFDNTTLGEATGDALALMQGLGRIQE